MCCGALRRQSSGAVQTALQDDKGENYQQGAAEGTRSGCTHNVLEVSLSGQRSAVEVGERWLREAGVWLEERLARGA